MHSFITVLQYQYPACSVNTKKMHNIYTMLVDVGPTYYKCYTDVLCLLGYCRIERSIILLHSDQ